MSSVAGGSDPIREWLRGIVAGRRFVIAAEVLQECGGLANLLLDLGASSCFLLGGRVGTGPLPPPELGPRRVLGLPVGAMMESIHSAERAFRALPDDVLAEIEAFDPDHEALAIGSFVGNGQPIAGRRMFGGRPAAWQALEDKVVIDAFWDGAGVPRAPSEVVPVAEATAAASRLDMGDGTVWAADAKEGFHGGATHTFRVHDEASRRRAQAFLAERADRVRVMPFLVPHAGSPVRVQGCAWIIAE